jgi:hypothetical protein
MTKSIINSNFIAMKQMNDETVKAINDVFASSLYIANPSDKTSDLAMKAYNNVIVLNEMIDNDAKASEINTAVEAANATFTELNNAITADWVGELCAISASEAYDRWVSQRGGCASYTLKKPSKTDAHYSVDSKLKRLRFATLNENTKGVSYIVYNEFVQTFIRNLNVWFTSDVGNRAGIGVEAPSINAETASIVCAVDKKYPDFQVSKLSKSKLLIQLNTIVAHMLPENHDAITLEKRHLNYVLIGFVEAKDGKVKGAKDMRLEHLIVDVLADKLGYMPITFESNSSQNKEKKSK